MSEDVEFGDHLLNSIKSNVLLKIKKSKVSDLKSVKGILLSPLRPVTILHEYIVSTETTLL